MLDVLAFATIAGAVGCIFYAFLASWPDRATRKKLADAVAMRLKSDTAVSKDAAASVAAAIAPPDDRVAALVVALLLLVLGVAAVAVDEKVADRSSDSSPPSPRALGFSAEDLSTFTVITKVHTGSLRHDVCLARFYTHNQPPAGKWWTTCDFADRRLATVGDVRRLLAVKPNAGKVNEKVQYVLPEGTWVTYVRGPVAPQCSARKRQCRYPGGGPQYLFDEDVEPGDTATYECTKPEPQAATYRPCR